MLKKRLVGVITVKNGWAVQSFGYSRYLPLGRPECMAQNLDRWGADEILVQIVDRSVTCLGPDFNLMRRLGELGLGTPLIYAGGIRSVPDGVKLVQLGADRIVVDALLHQDLLPIKQLSENLGAQAVIASLPISWLKGRVAWYDYRKRISKPISNELSNAINTGDISEVMLTDWTHEGLPYGFDQQLIEEFPLKEVSIIAFGGLTDIDQMKTLFQNSRVSALAVGNFLSYREHAIQKIKEKLVGCPLRLASYKSTSLSIKDV